MTTGMSPGDLCRSDHHESISLWSTLDLKRGLAPYYLNHNNEIFIEDICFTIAVLGNHPDYVYVLSHRAAGWRWASSFKSLAPSMNRK
jgi:hypothetical protein